MAVQSALLPAPVGVDAEEKLRSRQLRLVKLLYFLQGFSGSSFGRFATLFYIDRGLGAHQIGILEAVQPIATALGNQIFGALVDLMQCKKWVWLPSRVLTSALLLLLIVPAIGCCFETITIIMCAIAFFSFGGGVLDTYTLDLLGHARRGEYGQHRLWLAVAWGVGNAVMGLVAERNFDWNFVTAGALNLLAIFLMTATLPRHTRDERRQIEKRTLRKQRAKAFEQWEEEGGRARGRGCFGRLGCGACGACCALRTRTRTRTRAVGDGDSASWLELRAALLRPRMLFFLLELTLIGVGMTLVERFLFVYVRGALEGSPSLCGFSVAVTVVIEIPLFAAGAQLLKRLGHDTMVLLAVLAYSIRVYGYTLLTPQTVWWLLALEVLHGITFGLVWMAGVDMMKASMPARWQTTGQLLLSTATTSVGRIIGSLIGGTFITRYGQKELYLLSAIVSGALFLLHAIGSCALRLAGRRPLLSPITCEDEAQTSAERVVNDAPALDTLAEPPDHPEAGAAFQQAEQHEQQPASQSAQSNPSTNSRGSGN